MTLWPLMIVGVVGLILLVALAVGPKVTRGTRAVTSFIRCPVRQEPVRVDFRVTAWDGRSLDVDRCSAFNPATAIGCDKLCLRPAEFRRARAGATAA